MLIDIMLKSGSASRGFMKSPSAKINKYLCMYVMYVMYVCEDTSVQVYKQVRLDKKNKKNKLREKIK